MADYYTDAFLPAAEREHTYWEQVRPPGPGMPPESQFEQRDFATVAVGSLTLTGAPLYALDVLTLNNAHPGNALAGPLPAGTFPVELALARHSASDERVGLARIRFTDEWPEEWDEATTQNGRPATFFTSTGTFGFVEAPAAEALQVDPDLQRALSNQLEASGRNGSLWTLWQHGEQQAAVFTCGQGTGEYTTYLGYTEDDRVCQLLAVLDEELGTREDMMDFLGIEEEGEDEDEWDEDEK